MPWPGVRRGLRQFASLLLLLHADTRSMWSSDVHMSDASPYGPGVCCSSWSEKDVRAVGVHTESWRYQAEETVAARARALDES
eukprot:11903754-Karenia_brevis.AAC.1